MKKLFLFLILTFTVFFSYGQFGGQFDFESGFSDFDYVTIDTVSDTSNCWQIGIPSKSLFNEAYSPVHAIITDTLNPYTADDTSSFIITHVRPPNGGGNTSLQLNFWFMMNSDTLTDFGKIEASIDQGNTWVDLMEVDELYNFYWMDPKPILSGKSGSWKHFSLELRSLTYELGFSDTLLYRFSFISDTIQTNKDGWMLDDFVLTDTWEGIEELGSDERMFVYPNPAGDKLFVKSDSDFDGTIRIFNLNGQLIRETASNKSLTEINTENLRPGVYLIKVLGSKGLAIKKFTKE